MTWIINVDCIPYAEGHMDITYSFAVLACRLDRIVRTNLCFGLDGHLLGTGSVWTRCIFQICW